MRSPRVPSFVIALAALASVAVLGACPATTGIGGECLVDRECTDGDVCARDQLCTPPAFVRAVTTIWTVDGEPASAATCALHPDLYINYLGRDFGDTLGFAPVPCHLGSFFVDKLPTRFRSVELGIDGGGSGIRTIDGTNTVTFDLR